MSPTHSFPRARCRHALTSQLRRTNDGSQHHEQIESSNWHFTRTAGAQRPAVHVTQREACDQPRRRDSCEIVCGQVRRCVARSATAAAEDSKCHPTRLAKPEECGRSPNPFRLGWYLHKHSAQSTHRTCLSEESARPRLQRSSPSPTPFERSRNRTPSRSGWSFHAFDWPASGIPHLRIYSLYRISTDLASLLFTNLLALDMLRS